MVIVPGLVSSSLLNGAKPHKSPSVFWGQLLAVFPDPLNYWPKCWHLVNQRNVPVTCFGWKLFFLKKYTIQPFGLMPSNGLWSVSSFYLPREVPHLSSDLQQCLLTFPEFEKVRDFFRVTFPFICQKSSLFFFLDPLLKSMCISIYINRDTTGYSCQSTNVRITIFQSQDNYCHVILK